MIQDIMPKVMYNQYQKRNPMDKSCLFFFSEKKVWIAKDAKGQLHLPTCEEIGKRAGQQTREELLKPEVCQYLFSIDDTEYFWCDAEFPVRDREYQPILVRSLRQLISKEICFAVMTAWHLYEWYTNNRFCGRCGQRTVHDGKERMLRCPDCGNMIFPKIAPAVIICLIDGDRILMSKYADRDYKKYALLAGFTEIGETAEETVQREVMEEVGLKVKNIRYYKSQPWGIDSNLLLGFFCELDGDDTIHMDTEELAVAEWYHRDAMPAHDDGISLTREMMDVFEKGEAF